MKDINRYKGIFAAFYACYDDMGEISPVRVKALAEHLYKKGLKGLYVGGSSGECIYHSVPERKLVLESVMEAVGGKMTIIAHVGCNNTKDGAELAKHAESLGVDAIASIPPIYFHLPEYAISKYWNDMSDAAPNTDFVIYNIPQLAGVALSVPLVKEMLKNPRVAGVKNSSMPIQDIQMWKDEGRKAGRDFIVFNGPDEQLVGGLAIGADGGIGGTYGVMPELFLKIFDIVKNGGDLEEAARIQNDACRNIYSLAGCKGNMYAIIKEVLRRREGIDCGGVRSPLPGIFPEDEEKIAACVKMIDESVKRIG